MNRICLKRKQTNKKNVPVESPQSDNKEQHESSESENSRVSTISNEPAQRIVFHDQTSQRSNHPVPSNHCLTEFREQYEQLRKMYEQKRVECDDAVRDKRRLQIQLLNNNCQYYDKEIKRLREEVQKLQQANEDYKYKYFIAENCKKEFEATAKVKTEELKKTLQQLEKEKISGAEMKHQLSEKEKFYQRITAEMERSNQTLSKNFEDSTHKVQKLDSQLKLKASEAETLQKTNQQLSRKLTENEKAAQKNKDIFDQTNFKKSQIIEELQEKLRNLNRASRDTIEGLEIKLTEIKSQRKTENLLIDQKIESAAILKTQRLNELQVIRLEQVNKELKADYQSKCQLLKKCEEKLLNTYTEEEYQELQRQIRQSEEEKDELCRAYEEQISKLQKDSQMDRLTHLSSASEDHFSAGNQEFRQALKAQLEENAATKAELKSRIEELFNIKADIEDLKCRLRASEEQVKIGNKKIKSLQKNYKIQAEVLAQNSKNEIDSLRRKLEMTTNKLESKVKEVREKEGFIMNTIVGRSRQEDVPLIVAELQRVFETDYSSRLTAAQLKIQELQEQLK